jgi:hypothetical protein
MISWYNILTEAGIDFEKAEEGETNEEKETKAE